MYVRLCDGVAMAAAGKVLTPVRRHLSDHQAAELFATAFAAVKEAVRSYLQAEGRTDRLRPSKEPNHV